MTDDLQPHPLARLMPDMAEDEFAGLVADLQRGPGLIQPIVTHDGLILDGWHRYRACLAAGIVPTIQEYQGDDPAGFVVSLNVHRRHLSPGQRAVLIVRAQMAAPATLAVQAKKAGVSERLIGQARRVVREDPGLADLVRDDRIGLDQADRLVSHRQREAAEKRTWNPHRPSPGDEWKNRRDVLDILAFVRAWDEEMPKTIDSIEAGKFSPEAKRFLGHKLQPTVDRMVEFCAWLQRPA